MDVSRAFLMDGHLKRETYAHLPNVIDKKCSLWAIETAAFDGHIVQTLVQNRARFLSRSVRAESCIAG